MQQMKLLFNLYFYKVTTFKKEEKNISLSKAREVVVSYTGVKNMREQ